MGWLEARQVLRAIARNPGFSFVAILMLAAGTGSGTAVFALVNAVLLRALPFTDSDRLVWMYNARTERDRAPFSIPDLQDYAREATTLAGVAAFTNWTANLTGVGAAERLEGMRVSGDFFRLVGASAMLGRTLEHQDESVGARVAVLTYGLWNRRFGGDRRLVGHSVTLNGASYSIVGVMPPEFVFPFREAEVAVPATFRDDPRRADRGANFLRVVGRLRPGVTIRQAQADLNAIARRLQQQFPEDDARKIGVNLYPLQAEIVGDYRQILWTLLAAVGVLLAIGCGNLANLLLIRAARRQREWALRFALGASRGRIVRLVVMEAVALALFGGALGMVLARGAIDAWRALGPVNFPRMAEVTIDRSVLTFWSLAALGIAVASGLVPASVAGRNPRAALGSETRCLTGTRGHGLVRRGFVGLQVGGSAVLLVSIGLITRGVGRLEQVDPGFAPDHALSVQLSLAPTRYATREQVARFHDSLRERLDHMPGAQAVGAVSLLPLSGLLNTMDIAFPDRPLPPPDKIPQAHFRIAGPGYFAAAGIRVLAGREFTTRDSSSGSPVALVSRTFAARHWPSETPLGKHLQLVIPGPSPALEVVGEVNDVRQFTLDGSLTADVYVPLHQMPASQTSLVTARMFWVIRSATDPRLLEMSVKRAVHDVDPDVATSTVRTLDEVVSASLAPRRAAVLVLTVFGQVAVTLLAIGVYAIAAFSVGARTRELAIRSVFGASRKDLVCVVLKDELRPILIGLVAGLAAARPVAGLLDGVVFAISPSDPATYAAAAGALLAVALGASCAPAWRAGTAEPVTELRV